MPLIIPLVATPSQTLSTVISSQNCTINVYQKTTGLFMDLYVNGSLLCGGVACLNKTFIVLNLYLGFIGDFSFLDTQGDTDPVYTGLGSRYLLFYVPPSEFWGV